MWTNEIPTKAGWYWFYGDAFGQARHIGTVYSTPVLRMVQVREIVNGLAFIGGGALMFPNSPNESSHHGVWQQASVPEIPE